MKKKIQKISLFIFMINFLFVTSFRPAQALWYESYFGGNIMQTMMERIWQVFQDAMQVALKKMAIKLVMDRVRALILGQSGGGGSIIPDYEEYIYGHAERVAKGATRDFFSSLNSSASMTTRKMYKDIEKTMISEISPVFDDMKNEVDARLPGGKKDMFNGEKGGGINTFLLFVNNDGDNAVGTRLSLQGQIDALKAREQDRRRTEIEVGNGMEGKKDSNGLISLPGRIVSDIESFVETMELRSLVNAQKLAEVIGGTAAMMVTQVLQSGIDKTMKPVDNQLRNINKNVKGGVDKVQKNIYNGLDFDSK